MVTPDANSTFGNWLPFYRPSSFAPQPFDCFAKYDNIIILLSVENEKSVIIKYFSNGSIYEGDAENKNNRYIFSGKGKLINNEGDSYEGDFVNNLFHGNGIYKYSKSHDIYEGEFQYGMKKGKGK